MTSYVALEDAKQQFCKFCNWVGTELCECCENPVSELPRFDIVRCKDCKHWIQESYFHSCELSNVVIDNGEFFCSDGEAKGE